MKGITIAIVMCLMVTACERTTNIYNNFGYQEEDVSVVDVQVPSEDDCEVSGDTLADAFEKDLSDGVDSVYGDFLGDEGSVEPGNCFISEAHSTLSVPEDCETIQQAVDAATSTGWDYDQCSGTTIIILVTPGVYHENVVVSGVTNVRIVANGDGEVVIDGGLGCAFTASNVDGLRLALWNIALKSVNVSDSATVFIGFGVVAELDGVTIHTNSIGLLVKEASSVQVVQSRFVGNGSMESEGIYWSMSFPGGNVSDSSFENFGFGIYQCSGIGPELSSFLIKDRDSNSYDSVGLWYYFDQDCQ